MRRRLTVVLVLLIAGTLLAAGAGSLIITRQAARNDAERQLLREASTFTTAASRVGPRVLAVVSDVLAPEGGRIITITPAGAVMTVTGRGLTSAVLPAGLTSASLMPARLSAGDDVSGWVGGTAYAAVPADVNPATGAHFPPGSHFAVLLTRQVGALGPSWLYFLLISGITLAVAAAVAAWLARRLTRPLVQASEVTKRIASGELSARVVTEPSDYPELVSLGQSINSMAERLEGGRDRERQLLLSVSHDLRTPLTSIRGYAEAIAEGVAPDVVGAAGVIVGESQRLERLVADLLDLARLGADRLSLHIGPTDVAAVVGTGVEAFRPRASSGGIALSVSVPDPGVLVAADPDRLAQVVANLVENSLAFASSSVAVRVVALPAAAGGLAPVVGPGGPAGLAPAGQAGSGGSIMAAGEGAVLIVVEDDGPGIAPADLERVFDRFYQADRGVAARRGLGLGVAIVAELLRAMGGRVRAESPTGTGGGTRMVVELRRWSGP
jgi:two-component system sensor histidine kinase BaeS